jgi:hypothetical protein
VPVIAPGAASLAVRGPVTGPRQELRVIAADACAVYLELPAHSVEPRVIVLSAADVPRLPNAIALISRPDPPASGALDRIAMSTDRSGPDGSSTGRSGTDRSGTDRSGTDRSGTDRSGADGSSTGRSGTDRSGADGSHSWAAGSADGWAADDVWVGRGTVQVGGLTLRVLRWWDPAPVLGPLSRARLEQGVAALQRACASARHGPSLAGHDDPIALAACCAEGDLAGAVEAAERMTGLGTGLAPGGDNMISGLLLALRLLGGAIPGGTRAVWLADWLGAAVTSDAELRTTSLGATLLYCAAHGQATAEVSAVLLALAGQHPLGPAIRTLLAAGQPAPARATCEASPAEGHPAAGQGARGAGARAKAARATAPHVVPAQPAGADLAWGLVAGCRAALALAQPGR